MDENIPQIDKVCNNLLEEIQQSCHIRFQEWNESYCAFKVENRDDDGNVQEGVVYFYKDCKSAHVCHELLHAKCDVLFGNDVLTLFRPDEKNSMCEKMLDFGYWEKFSNHIQHQIFYTEYIKMGYVAKDFFSSLKFEGNGELKKFIKRRDLKVNNIYTPSLVAMYLDALYHFMFFPIDNRFRITLRKFKTIDPGLYKIHNEFYEVVKNIKLNAESKDTLQEAERKLSESLYNWVKKTPMGNLTADDVQYIEKLRDSSN